MQKVFGLVSGMIRDVSRIMSASEWKLIRTSDAACPPFEAGDSMRDVGRVRDFPRVS